MKDLLATLLLVAWMATTALAGYNDVSGNSPNVNQSVSNITVYGAIIQEKTTWDDIDMDMLVSDIGGLTKVSFNENSNTYDYATTCTTNLSDDHMASAGEFMHAYSTNTPMHPHVHFIQRSAAQSNSLWYMRYRVYPMGQQDGVWMDGGFSSNEFAYAGGATHQYAEFQAIPLPSNQTVSTVVDMSVWRNPAVGDGTVSLKHMGIHIEQRLTGSPTEMSY